MSKKPPPRPGQRSVLINRQPRPADSPLNEFFRPHPERTMFPSWLPVAAITAWEDHCETHQLDPGPALAALITAHLATVGTPEHQ